MSAKTAVEALLDDLAAEVMAGNPNLETVKIWLDGDQIRITEISPAEIYLPAAKVEARKVKP